MNADPQEPLHLSADAGGGRFPGFDVLAQSEHWDAKTRSVVMARLGVLPDIRFFTAAEEATACALCAQLLDQRQAPRVPVVNMIDARLVGDQTDGWHYEGMAPDQQAWRDSLAWLDMDSQLRVGSLFAEAEWTDQTTILQTVHDLDAKEWHGAVAVRVWGLWMRYACTAFYSHPWAWQEIGFAGPAYPRGYKNMGVDKLETFEVTDVRPSQDPVRRNP